MTAGIRCAWDTPGSSMRDPAPVAPLTEHDLRMAAKMLLGASKGDVERAVNLLRELVKPKEAL